MSLYNDGGVIRTYEEQVDHLTDVHRKQITINENLQREITDIGVVANLGGFNLVRHGLVVPDYAVSYRMESGGIVVPSSWDIGDYCELTSLKDDDIPAYGYVVKSEYSGNNVIAVEFRGDFLLTDFTGLIINVTKKESVEQFFDYGNFYPWLPTSLLEYNPNNHKKQLFHVINDVTYGTSTQYVSSDLNNDGVYNYVYSGSIRNGADGSTTYAASMENIEEIKNIVKEGDLIILNYDVLNDPLFPLAVESDVFECITKTYFVKRTNIRGSSGAIGQTGVKGDKGEQGERGPQGPQGNTGPKGDDGEQGDIGLKLHSGVLSSPSELPPFSSANIGDAYRIINTSGTIITYDLYFKTFDGSTWDIQSKWGGEKGDKGDKGDTGLQGTQGVQGVRGNTGPQGETGEGYIPTNAQVPDTETRFYFNDMIFPPTKTIPLIGDIITTKQGQEFIVKRISAANPPVSCVCERFTKIVGATGATGPQGPIGVTGATGPRGPAGLASVDVIIEDGFTGNRYSFEDDIGLYSFYTIYIREKSTLINYSISIGLSENFGMTQKHSIADIDLGKFIIITQSMSNIVVEINGFQGEQIVVFKHLIEV